MRGSYSQSHTSHNPAPPQPRRQGNTATPLCPPSFPKLCPGPPLACEVYIPRMFCRYHRPVGAPFPLSSSTSSSATSGNVPLGKNHLGLRWGAGRGAGFAIDASPVDGWLRWFHCRWGTGGNGCCCFCRAAADWGCCCVGCRCCCCTGGCLCCCCCGSLGWVRPPMVGSGGRSSRFCSHARTPGLMHSSRRDKANTRL